MSKCPSLITGNNGKPEIKIACRMTKCKRCGAKILKGNMYARIPKPGTFVKRTICLNCLSKIIAQSRKDLDEIEQTIKPYNSNIIM